MTSLTLRRLADVLDERDRTAQRIYWAEFRGEIVPDAEKNNLESLRSRARELEAALRAELT
ncbi:MAG: hypothetical protein L3K06_06965 [Thermoplasmata archaeon]|nr:hypothetical protein [Thermoplasmata archaeon]